MFKTIHRHIWHVDADNGILIQVNKREFMHIAFVQAAQGKATYTTEMTREMAGATETLWFLHTVKV